ncbi:LamG domain-containing protein [Streptomyces sp. NPDC050844]|uniref:LamG domain-containing protein n=1 Tax=Streptomyces sp. NPDC050844 TaxID=3155790 RepID=UPI0033EC01EC
MRGDTRSTRRWLLVTLAVVLAGALSFVIIDLNRGDDDTKPAASASDQKAKGKSWWPADEGKGRTAEDGAGKHDATLNGGVQWGKGTDGSQALLFDGETGFVDTGAPVLNTSERDYSVSARVRLDAKGFRTAVSQDGEQGSTFYLQYSGDDDRFSFSFANARCLARDAGPAQLGRWYHLAASYHQSGQVMRLYVDGEQAGACVAENPVRQTGNLVIGRGKSGGKDADHWAGAINDVRAFQRALTPDEVASLAARTPQ